ncbi:hypothetical protein P7K49_018716, partial [Saguinus oedipus]
RHRIVLTAVEYRQYRSHPPRLTGTDESPPPMAMFLRLVGTPPSISIARGPCTPRPHPKMSPNGGP